MVPPTVQVTNVDARIAVQAPLLDPHALANTHAAARAAAAATWDLRDAREIVTRGVTSAYL